MYFPVSAGFSSIFEVIRHTGSLLVPKHMLMPHINNFSYIWKVKNEIHSKKLNGPFYRWKIKESHFKLEKNWTCQHCETKVTVVSSLRKEEGFFMKGNYVLPLSHEDFFFNDLFISSVELNLSLNCFIWKCSWKMINT